MRISSKAGRTVFVMSPGVSVNCPRVIADKSVACIRDDYKGSVKAARKLFGIIGKLQA